MSEIYQNELRLKSGSRIMKVISRFSSTEKAIFGIFVIALCVSTFLMAFVDSNYFKEEIPARGGEIHEGLVGLPRTINPVISITDVDRDISALVYSGLMKYDGQNIVPDLAQSYTISDDGLTYSFKLRNDIFFQNGMPVTADDIEFTIKKIQDTALKSPRHADWNNVFVKKISASEIQFILKQPYSPFLSNTTIGILPKAVWDSVTNEQFIFSQFNIEPVGSGPYKITSVHRDSGGIPNEYTLSTWSNYYASMPFISNIILRFYPDQEKATAALQNGEIGNLGAIPAKEAAEIAKNADYNVLRAPLPRIFSVFFNQSQSKILSDKIVRQSLDLAIDRNELVSDVLTGYGIGISGPVPQLTNKSLNITTNNSSIASSSTPKAIKNAQILLEANGWKKDANGKYFKKAAKTASTTISFVIHTADSEELKKTAEFLKKTWNDMGAEVEIKSLTASDLYQSVIRTRKYDALLFGQQIGKDRDLYAFWHSSQRNPPGLNVSMYTNSKVDKILENIRTTNDDKERMEDYENLDELIREDIPAIFLYSPSFTYAVPSEMKGATLNSISVPSDRWNSVSNWYIKTEKVWKIFTNN